MGRRHAKGSAAHAWRGAGMPSARPARGGAPGLHAGRLRLAIGRWPRGPMHGRGASGRLRETVIVLAHHRLSPGLQRRRIMRLARRVEPDGARLTAWWSVTGIAEFGGLTASELSSMGRGADVEGFLRAVLRGERE